MDDTSSIVPQTAVMVMNQLVSMNNNGVRELEHHGNVKEAISWFTQALQASKDLMVASGNGTTVATSTSASLSSSSVDDLMVKYDGCCCFATTMVKTTSNSNIMFQQQQVQEQQQHMNIYRHPILLREDGDDSSAVSTLETSAVIIFNLALAYQLSYAMAGTNGGQLLRVQKAAKLYEMAYKLINDPSSTTDSSNTWFFLMATVNNMAVTFHEMNEVTASSRLFQHLLSMMMLFQDCGRAGGQGAFASEQHQLSFSTYASGFIQNVTPYIFGCDDGTDSPQKRFVDSKPAPAA